MSRPAAGIEALHAFAGSAVLDLETLASHRGLERNRFENLLMKEKTVALPCEDAVTFAVNAARPIVDALSPQEKDRIELLITCTESGLDFSKSISSYVHHHLGLNKNCRMFEIKQACYSGTAGLQMAVSFVLSQASPGAKALVIATDLSRVAVDVGAGGEDAPQDWSFAEPSGGAGAVAMLVSDKPRIFEVDVGANGYYGHEIMDTCRPTVDSEAGDVDLSLLSYLDCCEATYREYASRVAGADYRASFDYLIFHTPFGGLVKGAHRTMMRKILQAKPADIEADFERRVAPGLRYCQRVGNIMGGTLFLALASVIDHGNYTSARRIGCFSYGSGCCSEFFSGIVTSQGQELLRRLRIGSQLETRTALTIEQYEQLLRDAARVGFGTRDVELSPESAALSSRSGPKLVLQAVRNFHREYAWTRPANPGAV
jgi:polyketide biosynthesis 3-hydroxy-3-methylglutaryl-CoA synthase-like enzyme PksG